MAIIQDFESWDLGSIPGGSDKFVYWFSKVTEEKLILLMLLQIARVWRITPYTVRNYWSERKFYFDWVQKLCWNDYNIHADRDLNLVLLKYIESSCPDQMKKNKAIQEICGNPRKAAVFRAYWA